MIGELIAFIVAAGLYLGAARFLLRPVLKVAALRKDPVRFQMADLAALMLNVSIALAVSIGILRHGIVEDLKSTVLMAGSAISFASCLWWIAIRILSRARVQDLRKRGAFMIVCVPAAYVAPAFILVAFRTVLSWADSAGRPADRSASLFFGSAAICIGSLLFARMCHGICNWVASDCDPRLGASHKPRFSDE